MAFILAQADDLTDFQRTLRDQLREGGSISAFLLAVAAILVFVLLLYMAIRCQRSLAAAKEARNTPKRLFATLLEKLDLDREERDWLTQAATAAGLRHPAVLLLSEQLFDQQATAPGPQPSARSAKRPLDLAALRRRLFPQSATTVK